jgi:4-amino-4-deoxy-L-arabinose transferase-like glycosyltransferase
MEKLALEALRAPASRAGGISDLVALARRAPAKVLGVLLGLHLVVWTLLPILICPNLQLDLAEDLALGREWQLGYWKHPPLPWWIADLTYRATGQIDAIYILGPLAAVTCMLGVWLLGRRLVGELPALLAVVALEGVHFYNFSVVKFAHDQVQLPFWAFTALAFHRAVTRNAMGAWALAGVLLAGAFWSKYAAFALAATLGLVLILDPYARRAWATAGPYLMGLSFAIVIAPNLWWLAQHDFMPFHYVDERARAATHWYQYLTYPILWTDGQIAFLAPAIALLGLLYWGSSWREYWKYLIVGPARGEASEQHASDQSALEQHSFGKRYVAALAFGPFLFTTIIAAALGRAVIALWGYPLWSFFPLAVIVWFPPVLEDARLRRFAIGAIVVLLGFPLAYAGVELLEPFVHDRPKAAQFPGRAVAQEITRRWREQFGTPLAYVGGTEFVTNTVAVYSDDRPHAVVHGELELSPWVDAAELRRRGVALLWEDDLPANFDKWKAAYGALVPQPPLSVPRLTLHAVRPATVNYLFVPPRP